jgi:hypothetical protein
MGEGRYHTHLQISRKYVRIGMKINFQFDNKRSFGDQINFIRTESSVRFLTFFQCYVTWRWLFSVIPPPINNLDMI